MAKFKNKYRIESHRMPNWDYSGNGIYFITLVTQNRDSNLGEIIVNTHGKAVVQLSEYGEIVKNEWIKSFEIRNELICDEYIIMPNHLHAIVILDSVNSDNSHGTGDMDDTYDMDVTDVDAHGRAHLHPRSSQSSQSSKHSIKIIRKPKSISSFIAGFKSAVNSKIDDFIDQNNLDVPKYNKNNHFFQPNYHDHIIRNNKSYQNIKKYIIDNPQNWVADKLNNHE